MKVFISHSSKDKWAARRISQDIESLGGVTFLDEKDIRTGESLDSSIKAHLTDSEHFLILLSPASVTSEWVLIELGGAMALGKHIIPILLYVGVNEVPKAINLKLARDINDIDNYYSELRTTLGIVLPKKASMPRKKRKARIVKPPDRTYKPGDKVRIVASRPSDAFQEKGLNYAWIKEMDSYLGSKATVVRKIDDQAYQLDIDKGVSGWVSDWLIPDE